MSSSSLSSGNIRKRGGAGGRNKLLETVAEIAESEVGKKIQQFDLYPKSAPEAVEKTTTGAIGIFLFLFF